MKIGDYVRTKSGWIFKLDYYDKEEKRWITHSKNDWYPVYESEIKKYGELIDLIEEDDFVNGERVNKVIPKDICGDEILDYQHIFVDDKEIYEDDIKSILTKEQFESMEYKIYG